MQMMGNARRVHVNDWAETANDNKNENGFTYEITDFLPIGELTLLLVGFLEYVNWWGGFVPLQISRTNGPISM